ncbi:MAG: glycosyltransferase family 39 protein [Pseudomonadota bacterium]
MSAPVSDLRAHNHGAAAIPMAVILAITLWRIGCLAFNRVDLFMDESQYWLWGQEPAFGYYSKPPLIGWVIRLSTELGASDAAFWVRLPGPVLYGLTSVFVAFIAQALWKDDRAWWAGAVFATAPGVAILSLFISTDAALLCCVALSLLAMVRLDRGGGLWWALVLGGAVGLGLLAKYAMIYVVALGLAAWVFRLLAPPQKGLTALAAGIALVLVAPNLLWNIQNGFITLTHTAENAGWEGIRWNWSGMAEFIAIQLVALGPVFAAAYIAGIWKPGRTIRLLALFSLTVFVAIALQALIRKANGNWAAPAFVAATALAGPWVAIHWPRWLIPGLIFNGALAAVLPVATVVPDALSIGGRPAFERATGVRELSEAIIAEARRAGATAILSDDRRVLADLAYRTKGEGLEVRAWPVPDLPENHYQLTRPAAEGIEGALVVLILPVPDRCVAALEELRVWTSKTGALRRERPTMYLMTERCNPLRR